MQLCMGKELADIEIEYGLTDVNATAAQGLCRERFPLRNVPNHRIFSNVHHNLCKYGLLRDSTSLRRSSVSYSQKL